MGPRDDDRAATGRILAKLGSGMRNAGGDPMQQELPENMQDLLLQLAEIEPSAAPSSPAL